MAGWHFINQRLRFEAGRWSAARSSSPATRQTNIRHDLRVRRNDTLLFIFFYSLPFGQLFHVAVYVLVIAPLAPGKFGNGHGAALPQDGEQVPTARSKYRKELSDVAKPSAEIGCWRLAPSLPSFARPAPSWIPAVCPPLHSGYVRSFPSSFCVYILGSVDILPPV